MELPIGILLLIALSAVLFLFDLFLLDYIFKGIGKLRGRVDKSSPSAITSVGTPTKHGENKKT